MTTSVITVCRRVGRIVLIVLLLGGILPAADGPYPGMPIPICRTSILSCIEPLHTA